MPTVRTAVAAADAFAARVEPDQLRARIAELPAPRNRIHHPDRMDAAAELITAWFTDTGLPVRNHPVTCRNVTGYRDHEPFDRVTYPRLDGINLVATQPGTVGREAVVVLAHYDTVRDSPGADDNTASVVAMAEIARLLAAWTPRHTVLFAATDLEEPGFFGARALVEQLTTEYRVRLAINLECVAYTNAAPGSQRLPKRLMMAYPRQVRQVRRRQRRADFCVLLHNPSATRPARLLRRILAARCGQAAPISMTDPNGLPMVGGWVRRHVRAARHFRRSDHVAFWDRGIPAIQLTDTADLRYPHYHKPSDTIDRLDFDRLRDVVAGTAAMVAWLCGHNR